MHSYQTIAPHTSFLPEATSARTSTVHYPDGRRPCAKQITGLGAREGGAESTQGDWVAATLGKVGQRASEIHSEVGRTVIESLALHPQGSDSASLCLLSPSVHGSWGWCCFPGAAGKASDGETAECWAQCLGRGSLLSGTPARLQPAQRPDLPGLLWPSSSPCCTAEGTRGKEVVSQRQP